MPIQGLRLTATAAVFKGKGKDGSVSLVVQADGRDVTFTEKDGKYEGGLDVAVVPVDAPTGKTRGGIHYSLEMPLPPATYRRVSATGIRFTSRFDLPPGRYQLRIGAADMDTQRAGSVHYDLEVPDFSDGPLTMSGILLSSALAGQTRTAAATADECTARALPGPPTVSRDFRAGKNWRSWPRSTTTSRDAAHGGHHDVAQSDDGRVVYTHEDQR